MSNSKVSFTFFVYLSTFCEMFWPLQTAYANSGAMAGSEAQRNRAQQWERQQRQRTQYQTRIEKAEQALVRAGGVQAFWANSREKIFQIALCTLLIPNISAAQTQQDGSRWSTDRAVLDALRAVNEGRPFLYSSGGFFCSPKYQSEYREVARKLPVKSLACGCAMSGASLSQTRYALRFNNQVLALLVQGSAGSRHRSIIHSRHKPNAQESGNFPYKLRDLIP